MSTGEQEGTGRPRRVDSGEILEGALDRVDGLPDTLAAELLAELGRDDGNRVQRIQKAIESTANG